MALARTTVLIALVHAAGCATPAASTGQHLQLELERGPHDAGFDRIWHLDETRVWPRSPALDSLAGVVARPMRLDVWYPASCEGRERMTLADFVRMDSPAPAFDDLVFLTHRWDDYSYRGLVPDSAEFEVFLETGIVACAGGDASPGRFPLVVYSSGWFNRTPDNILLAEFLASHGFVVVGIPQLNPGLWTFNFGSDAAGVEAQTRDLETALGLVSQTAMVDRRRIAAMGYSTGGDVALFLQGRNVLVDAVVGLDPSWALGPDNSVEGSPLSSRERHQVPVLVLRRPTEARDGADRILESLDLAPRVVAEIPGAGHGSFSDDVPLRNLLGTGIAEERTTHATMASAVLAFLQGTLADDRGAFDGEALASELNEEGLTARYLPPAEPTDD